MRNIRKNIIIAFIIFIAIALLPKTNALAATTVSSFVELKQAIANGENTITINSQIDFTEPITIENGKNITFNGSGTVKLSDTWSGGVPFSIEKGATLTIDGVTLDGNGDKVAMRGNADNTYAGGSLKEGSFIYCQGTLNLKSGNIQNVTSKQTGGHGGIIQFAEDAAFNMSGGEIKNNKYKPDRSQADKFYDRGIISANKGTVINLSGGSINNNAFDDSAISYYERGVDYCWGGIVNLKDGTTLNMTGGAIENNSFRGLVVGTTGTANPPKTTVNMTGGKISNNKFSEYKFYKGAYFDYPDGTMENVYNAGYLYADAIGGGILIYQGTFNFDGGTISGNDAIHGGGVGVYQANGDNPQPAEFLMKGGTIED